MRLPLLPKGLFFLLVFGALMAPKQAMPANAKRIAHFSAWGANTIMRGIDAGRNVAPSICQIILTNPSNYVQNYSIPTTSLVVSATVTPLGSGGTGTPTRVGALSGSLAANGGSVTITWTYEAIPVGVSNYEQLIRCSGAVITEDTAAGRGFIVGAGTLTTLNQSSIVNSTTGIYGFDTTNFQTQAFQIGEGHPF